MSDKPQDVFRRAVAAHKERVALKEAQNVRFNAARRRLFERAPRNELQQLVIEFDQALIEAEINLQLSYIGGNFTPPDGSSPYINFTVALRNLGFPGDQPYPELRITIRPDGCAGVYVVQPSGRQDANIVQDDGSDFALPMEGDFPVDGMRSIFADYMEIVLKYIE